MHDSPDRNAAESRARPGEAAKTAMILAAGRGERMRPLTDERPKPLLEAGGRALIEWQLASLVEAGIGRVVINLGWLGEQIRDALGDGSRFGLQISYSEEGYPPLETGGGIFAALPHLGSGPFLVVNADVWSELPLGSLHCPADSLAHLVMVPNPDHNPGGDFRLEGGTVVAGGRGAMTYSGIGLYRPGLFEACRPGRFPLAPLLHDAIGAGRVTGQLYAGPWIDVGDPARLERLRRALRRGRGARTDPAPQA